MQKNGLAKYAVIALLIIVAFYVGNLNKKITTLEKAVDGLQNNGSANAGGSAGAGEGAVFKNSDLVEVAKKIGLNASDFEKCLTSDEIKKEVEADQTAGSTAGVNGTPGVFILDNQTGNIGMVPGAVPFEMLDTMVKKMLAGITEADKKTDPTSGIGYSDTKKTTLLGAGATDYVGGNKDAKFSLVEFSDIDCPFCKRFHPTAQKLVDTYKGQVNWVYRQFPLDQLHPNARMKAQGARCAGKLGGAEAFWKYLDNTAN